MGLIGGQRKLVSIRAERGYMGGGRVQDRVRLSYFFNP